MDQKRENSNFNNRRPRRKKKKKPDQGGDLPKQVVAPKPGSPNLKQKSPVKVQDRRKDGGREKTIRAEPVSATPRDLRLGSPLKTKLSKQEPPFRHVTRRYGVAVYDTFAAAKADKDHIAAKAKDFDQFNIVIKAEGNMDDPELLALGPVKVFAGAAWSLIHERRIQDGWYDTPR